MNDDAARPQGSMATPGDFVEGAADEHGEHLAGDSNKLLRLTVMAHELLDELKNLPLDEDACRRLRAIHLATLGELKTLLPEHLRRELEVMTLPLPVTASMAEVRLAQVQLAGWLEGLMQGIQAALWARVMHAISHARPPEGTTEGAEQNEPGQYL